MFPNITATANGFMIRLPLEKPPGAPVLAARQMVLP